MLSRAAAASCRPYSWTIVVFLVGVAATVLSGVGAAVGFQSESGPIDAGELAVAESARLAVRKEVAELQSTGQFEELMLELGLLFRHRHPRTSISFRNLDQLTTRLVGLAGGDAAKDPVAAREAAITTGIAAVREVYDKYQRIRDDSLRLERAPAFRRLLAHSVVGFEDLSNPDAALGDAALAAKAAAIIARVYPDEDPSVRARLTPELTRELQKQANDAKRELERFVRYIFFGTEGFGRRDRYIPFRGHQARRDAMIKAIENLVRNHAKFGHAHRSPFVENLIREQATLLAEILKDVPTPGE